MQLMKTSRRPAAPAAIAGENVGPDSAAGPAGIGLTKGERALFQAFRRGARLAAWRSLTYAGAKG